MVTRIRDAFAQAKAASQPALVTYVMGGDPNPSMSIEMAVACAEGGAQLLEIGIPFSDPIADGPAIQRAGERALAAGTKLSDVLSVARAVRRRTDVPILLMGYANPLWAMGLPRFLDGCVRAGVDGLIVPDLPPEEAGPLDEAAGERGLGTVSFVAPTSTPARRTAALKRATAFVYFLSVTGVTGARVELPKTLGAELDAVRAASAVPVVVGFGISSAKQVRELGQHADGVVVGSAIVAQVARGGTPTARARRVRRFVQSLREGAR